MRLYPWSLGRWRFWLVTGIPWRVGYIRVPVRDRSPMRVLALGPVALEWRRD